MLQMVSATNCKYVCLGRLTLLFARPVYCAQNTKNLKCGNLITKGYLVMFSIKLRYTILQSKLKIKIPKHLTPS